METNYQKCERLGILDTQEMWDLSDGRRCELCDKHIEKNLFPENPACEGKWCEDAIEYWLDETAIGEEKQ